MSSKEKSTTGEPGLFATVLTDIFTSPLNLTLVAIITLLLYKIFRGARRTKVQVEDVEPELPKMKKRDFTPAELKPYDGKGPDGRILIAVNGKVFDVSKRREFYGPGGPYEAFGGTDATRGLATFSVSGTNDYDDISDLNSEQMESVREWEMQFTERYDYVGRLLKQGQSPASYSDDEEEEASQQETVETLPNDKAKTE